MLSSIVGKYVAVIGIVDGPTAIFITDCSAGIGYFIYVDR
jgi:Na+-transporting methylmalonyl-CoA/oxaloacetate decarboxylase beta subunit